MKVRCEYCQSEINDFDEKCPNCGAVNKHLKRNSIGVPKTIDELKQWYIEHNLPDENVTRFFIGKDIKEKRAFGIYKDLEKNEFVVYKNKDNGQRAIRYQGTDEAFAVNELYLRLKQEILNQKERLATKDMTPSEKRWMFFAKFLGVLVWLMLVAIILFGIWVFVLEINEPQRGYYYYNDKNYYYQEGTWYLYKRGEWVPTVADQNLQKEHRDYYESRSDSSSFEGVSFEDTSYYEEPSSSSDWDSESSWSSGDSWDSGGSDWSSDW